MNSKNLSIPKQNISGFELPALNLNNFELKALLDAKNKLKVRQLLLGDDLAPIQSEFQGDILIDQRNIGRSSLNLDGEVKFSNVLLENPALQIFFNMFLRGKESNNGYYNLKISGTLSSPLPMFQ